MLAWSAAYPGIFIDRLTMNSHNLKTSPLGIFEAGAFVAATRAALARIESRPVGKDLLTLISKRCQGVGSGGTAKTCRILFGQGTLYNRHGNPTEERYATVAFDRTFAGQDVDLSLPEDAQLQILRGANRRSRLVAGRPMAMSGGGISAMVSYNPLVDYDVIASTRGGVPMPGFVALAHELVHALHILSGDNIEHPVPRTEVMIEEARTVGAGKYAGNRISENAIRREHGLPVRSFYARPGDCDAAALA